VPISRTDTAGWAIAPGVLRTSGQALIVHLEFEQVAR
jgi:hypothetical protein